ncbi:MAG: DNA adenine methylase [Actinomycetota bacterium]|nr:DNA adenine methylase [Actinomycetota bacterium]
MTRVEPVKPAINYYGGKAGLSPWIAALYPLHRVYLEVFSGSASVFFALCASPAKVFLSGYPSALYDELYGDWHRVERRLLVSASNHAGVSRHAVEVVWSNRPIACQLRLDGEPGALAAGEWLAPRAGERTASGVALGRRAGAHDAAPDNPQDGGRGRTSRICDAGTHDRESMTPPARPQQGGS